MRKILLTFFIITLIWVNTHFTHSLWEKNNSQTINYLIKYTDKKISDIEKISTKYDLEKNKIINKKIQELKDLKSILIKSRNTPQYEKYTGNITKKLKENNDYLKKYLKRKIENKKIEVKKYRIIYLKRIKPIINKINSIVINIAMKLKEKEQFNHKDKQIINNLYQIQNNLKNLENITNRNFNTKKDLQNYIIYQFNQVRNLFNQIKAIVKK